MSRSPSTEESVTVGVVVQRSTARRPQILRREDHVIELSRPLGDRKVVDATTGKAIRPRDDPF